MRMTTLAWWLRIDAFEQKIQRKVPSDAYSPVKLVMSFEFNGKSIIKLKHYF